MQSRLRHSAKRFNEGHHKSLSSYWTPQKIATIFLFDAFTKDIAGGKLYNRVLGRTAEYLTVTGSAGSYHYTCPDTSDYIAADTDLAWFKTGHTIGDATTISDMTDSRLNTYDLQRTPVQFDDASPNTNRRISILLSTVTLSAPDLNHLFEEWQLPIEWHNDTNAYGHLKSNRTGQNLWTPDTITIPTVSTATIENAFSHIVIITFNHTLNPSYVPSITGIFTLAGKTINNVAVGGAGVEYTVRLTVSVAYAYGDTITVSYTKPSSNWLRDNTTGGAVATFSGHAVTNNIVQPGINYLSKPVGNEYAYVSDNGGLDFYGVTDFVFGLWVKGTSASIPTGILIAGKTVYGGVNGLYGFYLNGSGAFCCEVRGVSGKYIESTVLITDQAWHFLLLKLHDDLSGNCYVDFYVDDNLIGTEQNTLPLAANMANGYVFYLGAGNTAAGGSVVQITACAIAKAMVYKIALTAGERTALMNGTIKAGYTAYWKCAAYPLVDETGNFNLTGVNLSSSNILLATTIP